MSRQSGRNDPRLVHDICARPRKVDSHNPHPRLPRNRVFNIMAVPVGQLILRRDWCSLGTNATAGFSF
jgi:hypothetical protein